MENTLTSYANNKLCNSTSNRVVFRIIIYSVFICLYSILTLYFTGTGNVLKIQSLLHICSEHYDIKDQVHMLCYNCVTYCIMLCCSLTFFELISLQLLTCWLNTNQSINWPWLSSDGSVECKIALLTFKTPTIT